MGSWREADAAFRVWWIYIGADEFPVELLGTFGYRAPPEWGPPEPRAAGHVPGRTRDGLPIPPELRRELIAELERRDLWVPPDLRTPPEPTADETAAAARTVAAVLDFDHPQTASPPVPPEEDLRALVTVWDAMGEDSS